MFGTSYGRFGRALHAIVVDVVLDHRREDTLERGRADNRVGPRDRPAVRVETAGELAVRRGAVEVVLHVVFARPHDLHRRADGLRVSTASVTKSASQRRPKPPPRYVVWIFTLSAGSRRPAIAAAVARACPVACVGAQTSTAVGADVGRAVHRLHRRVREERHLVHALEVLRRAR